MTEQLSALALAISAGVGSDAVAEFYEQWKSDTLVMDKWFAIQASSATPDVALKTVQTLADHPDFNWKNPNRFRSLIGPFAMSPAAFHAADGSGYAFIADWLIKLDAINPQTTARMCGVMETLRQKAANADDNTIAPHSNHQRPIQRRIRNCRENLGVSE